MADFTNFATERPNYFPGQYLLEDDFELQHKYLSDRQKYHNHSLHVSGIIEGLEVEVTPDQKGVLIKPGSAINNHGELIVLDKEDTNFNSDFFASPSIRNITKGDLFIKYEEEKQAEQQENIADSYTRWKEKAILQFASAVPDTDKDNCVKLAILTINRTTGVISRDLKIREYSGLSLPNSGNKTLTLRSGGNDNSNLAVLTGNLKIDGNLKLQDGVAVNAFSDQEISNSNSDQIVPTQKAVKSYVDFQINSKIKELKNKIDALLSPEFKSFWPPLGQPGINVLLFGRNFTVGKPTVKFGIYTAEIINSTDMQILTRVPLEFDSDSSEAQEVTITVTTNYDTIENPQPFKIPPSGRLPSAVKPVVSRSDSTSILQGIPGTKIYFQGNQFLEKVWFGTVSAQKSRIRGGNRSSYYVGYDVIVPEMLPGRVPISLQNEHGIVTLSETFSILTKSNYWYGFSAGIGGDLI